MRTLTRAAAVAASATAVILTTAPFASAGQGFEVWTDGEVTRQCHVVNEAGSAKFVDVGEHFYLTDHRADGGGVRASVSVNGDYKETLKNSGGSGTTTHYNRSYGEGAKVSITVYISTNGYPCGQDEESGSA